MAKYTKYSKELLEPVVKTCNTFAGVCRAIGAIPLTGNQTHIRNKIKEFGIDYSHFVGQAHRKGKTFPHELVPIEKYLSNERSIKSDSLRRRLIKEGLKEAKCEKCGIAEWYDNPAPLELDHINGDHFDNRLENLRILCANCHAVFGLVLRSIKKEENKLSICESCGNKKQRKAKSCIKCHLKKIQRIKVSKPAPQFENVEEVQIYVSKFGYVAASRKYGLTDSGIRKRLKRAGLEIIKQYPKYKDVGLAKSDIAADCHSADHGFESHTPLQ